MVFLRLLHRTLLLLPLLLQLSHLPLQLSPQLHELRHCKCAYDSETTWVRTTSHQKYLTVSDTTTCFCSDSTITATLLIIPVILIIIIILITIVIIAIIIAIIIVTSRVLGETKHSAEKGRENGSEDSLACYYLLACVWVCVSVRTGLLYWVFELGEVLHYYITLHYITLRYVICLRRIHTYCMYVGIYRCLRACFGFSLLDSLHSQS